MSMVEPKPKWEILHCFDSHILNFLKQRPRQKRGLFFVMIQIEEIQVFWDCGMNFNPESAIEKINYPKSTDSHSFMAQTPSRPRRHFIFPQKGNLKV
jgi:hypothetical protein